jgi:BirA family biotin operon repressor/biotin-[acetyl-CoA-carboxylase] ligase
MSDFSQAVLEQALAPRTIRFLSETGSTNDDAIAWLRDGARPGSLVIADEQGSGRGRLGRPWYAPVGSSLLLSVIVDVPRPHLTRLTMVGALAVYDVIRSYDIDKAQIKWPNDVRIDGRKVCGVLPEAAWAGNLLLGAVLGIGLNVNVPFILTAYAETAISLSDALGEPVDRLDTLQRLLGRIDHWLLRIATDDIFETWRGRLITLGTHVAVQTPSTTYSGIAEDVTTDGGLLLRTDGGRLEHILAGEIIPLLP